MLNNIVKTGCLWLGKTWKEAIELSLRTRDCGIETVFKDKYPDKLFDAETAFSHFNMIGAGNGRNYRTRIPKSLNDFVAEKLKEAKSNEHKN